MFEPTKSSPTITAATANGGPKRHKPKQPPLTVPAGCACFRLLCHASRIGGVIGKSGVHIKHLQQETSAKIRVEDPPPGSEDRVITVIGNTSINKTILLVEDKNRVTKNNDEGSEYSEVSAAQEALIKVYERILLVAAEANGGQFASGGVVSCRLLAEKITIGSVIGKAGKVIEKIRKDTGCKIRILSQDKLPSCALPTDEMVEMEGNIISIKKALISVTRCLQDSPHVQKTKTVIGRTHTNEHTNHPPPRTQNFQFHPPTSINNDKLPAKEPRGSKKEIVFRMLYPGDKVGCLIGKLGIVIQAIQNESGAHITVSGPVSDCDERLITITATENAESPNSAAQKAIILIFNKSVESGFQKVLDSSSSTGTHVSARLVISHNQMGCLLGKGGSIVADMRKVTGAFIKIVGDNQVPKCAHKTDQIVLMSGEMINVRDAIYSVTGRLRNNLFSNKTSNGPTTTNTKGKSHYSNLTQNMNNLKLFGTESSSVKGGIEIGSGGRSTIVSNMSVEIIVPEHVIALVYGENGSNLTRLRQISGAKVVVNEPHSGTTDHIVVISGTPDETQSAQSLLQAFILAGKS